MTALLPRRHALAWTAACVALHVPAASRPPSPHEPFGPVRPPLAAPALRLTGDDGANADLRARLHRRVTAVQLMFTGCSATCPIQGALFAAVAPLVAGRQDQALLSISIDPLSDSPQALRSWLARFGTHANWRAAVPDVDGADRLLEFLNGRASDDRSGDRHTAQIYLFDRQARLVYRTADMPAARFVADLMAEVGRVR